MPPGMSNVSAASMSMASLYAMLGLAMPSGAAASGSVGSSPALAMISASSESAAAEVGALIAGMPAGAAPANLTSALLSLANLDPTVELQRLGAALGSQLEAAAETNANA